MILFRLAVDGVDGHSSWFIQTEEAFAAEKFLKTYDHEGSSVSLTVFDTTTNKLAEYHSERVYDVFDELHPIGN